MIRFHHPVFLSDHVSESIASYFCALSRVHPPTNGPPEWLTLWSLERAPTDEWHTKLHPKIREGAQNLRGAELERYLYGLGFKKAAMVPVGETFGRVQKPIFEYLQILMRIDEGVFSTHFIFTTTNLTTN